MTTRDIRTSHETTVCDVCGRTLLRGEHAEIFINGGARRSVCELCKGRAIHEGWIREGTLPEYDAQGQSSERRRSIFGRRRNRREPAAGGPPRSLDDELGAPWPPAYGEPALEEPEPGRGGFAAPTAPDPAETGYADELAMAPEEPSGRRERPARPARRRAWEPRDPVAAPRETREPRHVRAVPTSDEQKIASAIALFNASEHRRTVSGVARSLGLPIVSVRPDGARPSLMRLVVSWELCWYRYEVDLSDEVPTVQVEEQGYELAELGEPERLPNAVSDDTGELSVP